MHLGNIIYTITGLVFFLSGAGLIARPDQTPALVAIEAALILASFGQFLAQDDRENVLYAHLSVMYAAGLMAVVAIILNLMRAI